MDWYKTFERHRSIILIAIFLIAATTLLVSTLRVFVGFDAFWHLQMGKDLIENGLNPFTDHYSFTFKGENIVGPPVIFQVALYELVKLLGEFNGFFAMRAGAFFLALIMMSLWLRTLRAPVVVYCLVIPMLTVLMQFRAIVRPELISYSLIILAFLLYQRTRFELTFRAMWPIAALLLLWTNYHSSILAYVIFFGLFVDVALRFFKEGKGWGDWALWALWGGILIAIGFLNADLNHAVIQFTFFPSAWKVLIQEYRAPTYILSLPAVWILIAMLLLTLGLLAKQKKFGFLIVAVIFSYAGITMGRMVTPGGIVILCLLAHVLSDNNFEKWLAHYGKKVSLLVGIMCAIAITVPMINAVQQARGLLGENRFSASGFPYYLTEHMIASRKSGRIFNSYSIGGYLIYRLPRDYEVYIDGRTGILYSLEHYETSSEASTYPEAFLGEVDKYDIQFAILDASDMYARLMSDVGFELDFVDIKYALWVRDNGMLAASGNLWAKPACWTEDLRRAVDKEWAEHASLFPTSAPVVPLLSTAHVFSRAVNTDLFFETALKETHLADSVRRFLLYRALESGRSNYALSQWNLIKEQQPQDLLAGALVFLRLKDFDEAEALLDRFSRTRWVRLDFSDVLIQHALLHELSQERPLKLFDTDYLQDLNFQVADFSLPAHGESVTVSSFCRDYTRDQASQ